MTARFVPYAAVKRAYFCRPGVPLDAVLFQPGTRVPSKHELKAIGYFWDWPDDENVAAE